MEVLTPTEAKPLWVLYYSGYMPRTRDLLIVVVSILLTFLVWVMHVLLSPLPEAEAPTTGTQTILLSTPKDSYEVVPYEENTLRDERDAFIEKVRQTYVAPIQIPEEPLEDPFVSEFETPPAVVNPVPTTTTPYIVPGMVPVATTSVATATPPYGNTHL